MILCDILSFRVMKPHQTKNKCSIYQVCRVWYQCNFNILLSSHSRMKFPFNKKMQYGKENKLKFIALPFHYSSFFLNFSISVPVVIVPLVIFFLGHVIFMVNSSFDFQLPFKKSKRDRFWLYADIFLTTKHNAQTFYPSLL